MARKLAFRKKKKQADTPSKTKQRRNKTAEKSPSHISMKIYEFDFGIQKKLCKLKQFRNKKNK